MKLRNKTSLLLAVIILTVLSAMGFFYLRFLEKAIESSIFAGLSGVSSTSAEAVSKFLQVNLRDAQVIASGIPKGILEKQDKKGMQEYLREVMEVYPQFSNGIFILDSNVHAEMFAAPLMMKGGIKGAGEGEVAQVNTWLGPSQLTRPIVSHRTPDCFYRERTVIGPRVPGTRRLIRNMSSPSQHTFYRRSRGHGTGTDPQERYRP